MKKIVSIRKTKNTRKNIKNQMMLTVKIIEK